MKPNFRYTSEYNSEYAQRKAEAIEYILDHKYGDTVAFDKLAQLLHYNIEIEEECKKFKNQMGVIKNFLITKGYILKTISGVGYYILKPKQISGYCYHTYIKRTLNLLNKSGKILDYTDISELSTIRLKEYNEVKKLNKEVTDSIDNTIYESEYAKNKDTYDSLKD